MSSPVGHSLISFSLASIFDRHFTLYNFKYIFFILFFASLPDFDLFPILIWGIEKGGGFHQLYTHTLLFAFLAGGMVYLLSRNSKMAQLAFIILVFHILADILVTDYSPPIGVPLFSPFWNKSFCLGLLPGIQKSSYFQLISWTNAMAVLWEIIIFLPLFLIIYFLRKGKLSPTK